MKKVKVVFLFASNGAAPPGAIKEWNPKDNCDPSYTQHHSHEGYIQMLGKLWEEGVINDLKIFYESNRGPGLAEFYPGVYGEVTPNISFIDKYIDNDTIIFVRGGFRFWHDWLKSKKGKNWLMLYAANTGREKWPWWDIVLHDLERVNFIDKQERYWHYFIKPIDQELFHPMKFVDQYDICVGANHIHDRKGQWRTIHAMIAYRQLYGEDLRAVLPGSFRRGVETNYIPYLIAENNLSVTFTGMVPRKIMATLYNSSRLFIHLTTHGQNDRGPLEAMACGCPIMILTPERHSPIVKAYAIGKNDHIENARTIHNIISTWKPELRSSIQKYFYCESDFENVILPRMRELFLFMSNHSITLESKIKLQKYFEKR